MATAFDLVRVKNVGDAPISGAYGGNGYLIPVGGDTLMETECAKKDFGDWDTRNLSKTEEKLRFRDRELRRVRGLYGVTPGAKIPVVTHDGKADLDDHGVPKEVLADVVWKDRMPKVEIYSMDGTRLTTVIEDPEGESLPLDGSSDDKDLALAEMRAQIDKLQDAIVGMQVKAVDIPVDSPETAPRPTPKKAKVHAAQTVSQD